jgi:hypothetical protein
MVGVDVGVELNGIDELSVEVREHTYSEIGPVCHWSESAHRGATKTKLESLIRHY